MHAEAAPLLAMSLEVCALPSINRSHRVGVKLKRHCTGSCTNSAAVMYCCPVRARAGQGQSIWVGSTCLSFGAGS